ncbi:rubredoxin [Synechococcus sp. SYN20]|uniref:rubredoxin n=1 Tax=Synechococcus sp. SYN20 TaxID=1050714 RepID=UPI001649054D|nr:rubredoxin [Synechococcus sp. SYN20]QNJ24674.1 rubredoxin [Synechococcus sp. SYN20]
MSDEISPTAEVPAEVDPPAEELIPTEATEAEAAIEAEASEEEASASADNETSDPRTHRFECRSCGYVYDPNEGVKKMGIVVGTAFEDLDPIGFRCPVCRSRVGAFTDIGPRSKASGFEENLNFGLGVNRLTPGQKNVLIFGGLALGFAFFLSLYSLR